MDRALFTEFVQHSKSLIDSMQRLTQLARGKFSDKAFEEFFEQSMAGGIEKSELLLDGFLSFMKVTAPTERKKDTVNTIIAETLKRHQVKVEERKVRVFSRLEKDLPEAAVPHEQLQFVLDSLVRYALAAVSPAGNIEVFTRSFTLVAEKGVGQTLSTRNGKTIEIRVGFTTGGKPNSTYGREWGSAGAQEAGLDILLRLLQTVAQASHGMLSLEPDPAKARKSFILKFPVERRKGSALIEEMP